MIDEDANPSDDKKRPNIFEILDELIYHLDATKKIFTILILSAFILAPITIALASIVIGHPHFLFLLMRRMPDVASVILIHSIVTMVLAVLWLFIGVQEYRFFNRWGERFKRFRESQERIDRELGEGDDGERSAGHGRSGMG
ncbi:MAG: hypothetical protein RMJ59_04025 [Candidatus Nitrosocaldus sp.]|nr:hypothetical protein [Candidatus Nitrosocaldus sp.]MCS7141112.1 hypothetical protein [Candidatus Nitrosocaldus sp.]MDW8000076.1 hypothetical protein [Candidatus Nitrosocaldus sp.]MDW8275533.1 hypothetical protein [Candidatus Nitrosocaldus sp.]